MKKMGAKLLKNGGASRDRTDDLIVANDALSQLSYSPTIGKITDDRRERPNLRS